MTVKYLLCGILLSTIVLFGCTKEYNCTDLAIQPVFIGFSQSDIDTFVIRKFKSNDNYQNLIDTFIVKYGDYSIDYKTSNDTTLIFVGDASNDSKGGIKFGYDWQIFIPAKNKTVFVSDIISENKTGKHSYGIFNLDKVGNCTNRIFSAKLDNQIVSFLDTAGYNIFIRN